MSSKAMNDFDALLSELGLCRKSLTKDDTCLFRAVSEKLFYTQTWHGRVRDNCLDYLTGHIREYQPLLNACLKERIQNIRDHKVRAGHLEMIVLARMYRLDFVIFQSPSLNPVSLTQNYYQNQIVLCSVEDSHYDLVYTKQHIETAGICQSIIYEVLYKGVFGLDSELEEAVLFLELQKHLPRDDCMPNCSLVDVVSLFGSDKVDTLQRVSTRSCPPVPYRIAKALHPALYRNVELDIVHEERREARLRTLDACKGFSPGDKCQVVLAENEHHPYNAHIQFINEQEGTVVVFVEELGVKRSIAVNSIRPLPLQSHRPGDSHPSLPVAELDLLPYVKKKKQRKNQQLLSLLSTDGKGNTTAAPFYRDLSQTSSSNSYCNNISNSSSDINPIVNSTIGSGSFNSQLVSDSNSTNSNSDRISCVAPPSIAESYIYPSVDIGLPCSYYYNTNPLIDFSATSNSSDTLLIPRLSYTSLSYGSQLGRQITHH